MAGFDVDTSIYPKANPNALTEQAGQFVGLANAAQQNQLLRTTNQQTHQDLVKGQLSFLSSGLGALAAKPDLSQNDMLGFAQRSLQEGVITPDVYGVEVKNIAGAGNDPAKLRGLANGYLARTMSAGEQYANEYGLPLGTMNQLNSYTNAQGGTTTGTNRQIVNQLTGADPMDIGLGPAAGTVPQSNTSGPVTGAAGGATIHVLNGSTDGAAPAPYDPTKYTGAPSPAQGVGIVNSPNAGQQAAMTASNAQFQADKAAAASYKANQLPAEELTALLPGTLTGPGTEAVNTLGQVAASFGIPWTSDQSQNLSEVKKWAGILGRSLPGATSSVAQLESALDIAPGATIDNKAARNIAANILALGRMKEAVTLKAMDDPYVSGNNYTDFAGQLGAKVDPRAFRFDLMSDAEKKQLATEFSKGTKAARAAAANFNASYDLANKYNLFNSSGPPVPSAANGQ